MTSVQMSLGHTETFSVPPHLIGLALGDKHSNLKKTRSLKGIKNITFKQKDHSFTIDGYNEEIVKIVRDLLEYSEREIVITRCLSDLLQHSNDRLIQQIIQTSGLVRAEICDDDVDKPSEKQSEFLKLKFVGTISSIDEAKSCVKTLMTSPELSKFQSERIAAKKTPAKFVEKLKIASHLVGLAIGNKGANIDNAKKLPGIVRIEQEDTDDNGFAIFEIHSNNPESLKKARQMLELVEDKKYIPPNKAGLVIGSGGATVKEIIRKTQVLRIEVKEKEMNATGLIPVVIIGHPDQVDAAKMCIESKIPS